jgi:hypothetical protein
VSEWSCREAGQAAAGPALQQRGVALQALVQLGAGRGGGLSE